MHICIIYICRDCATMKRHKKKYGQRRRSPKKKKKKKDLPAEKTRRYCISDNPRITVKDDRSLSKLPPRYVGTWFPTGLTSPTPTLRIPVKNSKKTPIPGFRPSPIISLRSAPDTLFLSSFSDFLDVLQENLSAFRGPN